MQVKNLIGYIIALAAVTVVKAVTLVIFKKSLIPYYSNFILPLIVKKEGIMYETKIVLKGIFYLCLIFLFTLNCGSKTKINDPLQILSFLKLQEYTQKTD